MPKSFLHLPDTLQTTSRHPPDNLQTTSRQCLKPSIHCLLLSNTYKHINTLVYQLKHWSGRVAGSVKNFGSWNFFVPDKFLDPTNFWTRQIFGPENCWSYKIFGHKKFLVKKNVWSKKMFGQKKCLVKKNFGQINFGQKNFWSKIFLVNDFLGQKIWGLKNF